MGRVPPASATCPEGSHQEHRLAVPGWAATGGARRRAGAGSAASLGRPAPIGTPGGRPADGRSLPSPRGTTFPPILLLMVMNVRRRTEGPATGCRARAEAPPPPNRAERAPDAPASRPRPVDQRSSGAPEHTAPRRDAPRPVDRRSAAEILVASDVLACLLVLVGVAFLSPSLERGLGTQLAFVAAVEGSIAASFLAKRVYARTRWHLVPTAADDLGALFAALLTALLVVLSARTLAAGTFGHVLPLAPTLAAFALAAAV